MVTRVSVSSHPELPASPRPTVYSDVTISEFIPYWNIIENVPEQSRETRTKPTPMEQLDINNGNGQSYGYIVYRKTLVLRPGMKLKIRGHPRDLVQVINFRSVRSSRSQNLRPVRTCQEFSTFIFMAQVSLRFLQIEPKMQRLVRFVMNCRICM